MSLSTNDIEQIIRVLDPATRETVRDVLQQELRSAFTRIEKLESDVSMLKDSKGKLFGIWAIIVFILTIVGKSIWDTFIHRRGP